MLLLMNQKGGGMVEEIVNCLLSFILYCQVSILPLELAEWKAWWCFFTRMFPLQITNFSNVGVSYILEDHFTAHLNLNIHFFSFGVGGGKIFKIAWFFKMIVLSTTTLCYLQNWMFYPITLFKVVRFKTFLHKLGSLFRQSFCRPTALCYLWNCSFCSIFMFISILFALCIHKPYFLLFKCNFDSLEWKFGTYCSYTDLEISSKIKLLCVPTHYHWSIPFSAVNSGFFNFSCVCQIYVAEVLIIHFLHDYHLWFLSPEYQSEIDFCGRSTLALVSSLSHLCSLWWWGGSVPPPVLSLSHLSSLWWGSTLALVPSLSHLSSLWWWCGGSTPDLDLDPYFGCTFYLNFHCTEIITSSLFYCVVLRHFFQGCNLYASAVCTMDQIQFMLCTLLFQVFSI